MRKKKKSRDHGQEFPKLIFKKSEQLRKKKSIFITFKKNTIKKPTIMLTAISQQNWKSEDNEMTS